jgi:hypothetical protein
MGYTIKIQSEKSPYFRHKQQLLGHAIHPRNTAFISDPIKVFSNLEMFPSRNAKFRFKVVKNAFNQFQV